MEKFELPLWFNGQEMLLPAEFQPWGYSHRITVMIGDLAVVFEPDEERNYRALIVDAGNGMPAVKTEMLQCVSETLTELFGS